jgi:hypothetical protein
VAAFLKSANAADIISFQLLRSISRCNMIQDLECVAVHLFAVEFFRHWVGRDINVWVRGLELKIYIISDTNSGKWQGPQCYCTSSEYL